MAVREAAPGPSSGPTACGPESATAGEDVYKRQSCSDARHFHRVCPRTYRFAGILFAGDSRSRIHGQDERLDVEAYKRGVGFYTEFIRHLDRLGK